MTAVWCLGCLAALGGALWTASEARTETSSTLRMGSGSPFPTDEGTRGPFAPKDCAVPREKPRRLVLRCDGFDAIVNGIGWRTWGRGRATGSGRFELNRKTYPVTLEIHRVRKRLCGDERLPMFTRAELNFRGKAPDDRPPRRLRCSLLDSGWSP